MNKLALGTAQFGSKYGITNNRGQVEFKEAEQILKLAKNSNIDLIDTAIGYGNSEKVLGKIGSYSLEVYMVHWVILFVVYTYLYPKFIRNSSF